MSVAAHLSLSTAALADWLAEQLGGEWAYQGDAGGNSHESLIFRRGGTNERVVARLEPASGPYPSYDVVAEADLLRHLNREGLPVPRLLALEPTGGVAGCPFMVTEWVPGHVVSPASVRSPEAQMSLVTRVLEAMVKVHGTSVQTLTAEAGRFCRTFDEMVTEFESALTGLHLVDVLVLDYARVWLASTRSLVETERGTLVHGDFRLGNLLWEPDGSCRILDWEAAHIGSGLFDLAWLCMGAVEDSDTVMGLAPKADVVSGYESLTGQAVCAADMLWWQIAAAWIRGCTEARLLDRFLSNPDSPAVRDPQELLWEFGSYRTDREILALIDRFEAHRPVA